MSVAPHLYPFEGKRLDVGGVGYHYLDQGSGDPVLMIHGNPTWSFYYRNLINTLSDRYRTIAPDHIGCGFSDKPADSQYDYTLSRRVADLDTLISHLNLKNNITLVLHDWGGMIGMAWASQNPERIKRIVLLNTAAFHLPTSKPFPWALWVCRNTWIGTGLVRGANAFASIAARVGVKRKPMPKDVKAGYLSPYDSWDNRIATLRFVQDIPLKPGDRGFDLISAVAESLPRFADLPILICWGMQDFVFDQYFLAEWERIWPKAQVHRFEDCGHYILEDASEEVLSLINTFLSENPL